MGEKEASQWPEMKHVYDDVVRFENAHGKIVGNVGHDVTAANYITAIKSAI
jgi:hypothetical protein